MKIPIATVVRGYRCNIHTTMEYVFRSEEQWKSVFQEAFPGRSFADHGAGYDFFAQTLIAVFLGSSPEHSAVKIEEVRENQDSLEVMVSRNVQKSGTVAWNPYHIIRVSTTEKPVQFNYQDKPTLTVSDIKKC